MPLQGYWPLTEDSGSTAYDHTGNGNDGTLNGGVTQGATGLLGTTCYDFDGTDGHITTGLTGPQGNSSRTITAWINTSTIGNDMAIVGYGAQTAGNKFRLLIDGDNGETLRVEAEGGYRRETSGSLATGSWKHVCAVFPSGASDVTDYLLYVDGSEVSSYTGVSQSVNTNDGNKVTIGDHPAHSDYFNGRIAEVRIYDHDLTAGEIQYLYQSGVGPGSLTTDKREL